MAGGASSDTKAETKIFVSYSRKDTEKVVRVMEVLRADERLTVFKDTEDILPTEEWRKRLEGLIIAADTIVFCLSPNSAVSEVCAWEVETAERLNKRIAPLVIERVDGLTVPGGLAKLNYTFATERDDFERAMQSLLVSINTDINWIREHTRVGELTLRWLSRSERRDALLRGRELEDAETWVTLRPSNAPPLTAEMSRFLALSRKEVNASARRRRLVVSGLVASVALGALAFYFKSYIQAQIYWLTKVRPYVLTAAAEAGLNPGYTFHECAEYCPEMVVLPRGKFVMGSPTSGMEGPESEITGPQHEVTIDYRLAVGKFEVTFDQWDACVAVAACKNPAADNNWGRGSHPVINVSWNDAKEYVTWVSKVTGKPYRLLSEAEWEYAARAGNPGRWSFGDNEEELDDYAWYIKALESGTHPVGTKKPNAFGLHDMHGNVWEWVEDCYVNTYKDAPSDGSARLQSECSRRVYRGGSFVDAPGSLRSSERNYNPPAAQYGPLGFRLARSLSPS